jgi:plasmid stabilization system protein ParE
MNFRVTVLRRADADAVQIVNWIGKRSPQGAEAWVDAYEQMLARLEERADSCGRAYEDDEFELPLRETLFRTRHGATYRAVFTVAGDQVRILRIRGPGQRPLTPDELL